MRCGGVTRFDQTGENSLPAGFAVTNELPEILHPLSAKNSSKNHLKRDHLVFFFSPSGKLTGFVAFYGSSEDDRCDHVILIMSPESVALSTML
jgi:hypothetical protein